MLIRLEITDFAVISNVVFEPDKGLNVITGETGAGKSLLVDAIDLIMGGKSSKNLIRAGKEKAFVEAVFDISSEADPEFLKTLSDSDVDIEEDGLLIISRTVYDNGRTIARINGNTVNISLLRDITSYLVEIHGQYDTQKIFDDKYHVELLDRFAGDKALKVLKEYQDLLEQYKTTVHDLKLLKGSPEKLKQRREYLEFVVNEIDKASFADGEEETLFADKKRMEQYKNFAEDLTRAMDLAQGASDNSAQSSSIITKIASKDEDFKDLAERFESIYLDLKSVSDDISRKCSELDVDQNKIDEINSRISLLFDLKSKYGNSIAEINSFKDKCSQELTNLDDDKERYAKLRNDLSALEKKLIDLAKNLSDIRHKASSKLEKAIVSELNDLEIPKAQFVVEFEERTRDKFFSSHGTEDISFLFSANPGLPPRPLSATASGGEASRIMLAVKNILTSADSTPTLIFDEIDTGISGKAANGIADKLKSISGLHQVLCVTHTPQIAACADNNFIAGKKFLKNNTSTELVKADADLKVREVSRMLSGSDDAESMSLAQKLIDSYK
ncbi:MAG: DNA repair protein RecN [Clostridiales bacterium]|nr:DNA repair protein RecN [Clostridiales bacterium]